MFHTFLRFSFPFHF